MPGDRLVASHTVKVSSHRYSVEVDSRGAIGVTQWTGVSGKPRWPTIVNAVPDFVTLESGACVPLPGEWWVHAAVDRWNATRLGMISLRLDASSS